MPNLRELRKQARERFLAGRKAESQYATRLRQVARQIDALVRGFAPDGIPRDLPALIRALEEYSRILQPWAESVAAQMLADVLRRDEKAWLLHGRSIGRELGKQLRDLPIGGALRGSQAEQVNLITSLPLAAAERVQKLADQAVQPGRRPTDVAKEILASGSVSRERAALIARTEVAKASSLLTQNRAIALGVTHYVWRTAQDARVRQSHKEMDGKTVSYAEPPLLSDGTRTHAGQIYNCRCFQSPILE